MDVDISMLTCELPIGEKIKFSTVFLAFRILALLRQMYCPVSVISFTRKCYTVDRFAVSGTRERDGIRYDACLYRYRRPTVSILLPPGEYAGSTLFSSRPFPHPKSTSSLLSFNTMVAKVISDYTS